MNAYEDSYLVGLSQQGENWAFDELYVRYWTRLVKHVGRFSQSRADAEDIVQEAFLRAFRGIPSFREESTFFTWIYRITRNCSFTKISKANLVNEILPCGDFEEVWDNTGTLGTDPFDEIWRDELLSKMDEVLESMPECFAHAFVLRELSGLSYDEIAEMMKCSVGTVRSRLFRARQLLTCVVTRTAQCPAQSRG